MDVIGWLNIGTIALLLAGGSLWAVRGRRRRIHKLRAFAAANAMTEIAAGVRPPELPAELRPARGIPAFRGSVQGIRMVSVPLRTRVRWGYAWAIVVETRHDEPVLVLNLVGSDLWRLFGHAPRSWTRAALPRTEFARHFAVYHRSGATLDHALPAESASVLSGAYRDVVAWIVRADRIGVLMVRENYGATPDQWLSSSLAIARALA